MKYSALIAAVLNFFGGIFNWFRRRADRKQGSIEERDRMKDAVIEKQGEVVHDLEAVRKSDDAVRDWIARNPGRVPDKDPNRRD